MNLYRVIPSPPKIFDLTVERDRQRLALAYAPSSSSSLRAIMVTDSSGRTIDASGTSGTLSQGVDRTLLGLLRESSDVVITGASTLRAERVPLPRGTPLVVLTRTGNLSGHQIFSRGSEAEKLIVMTREEHRASLEHALEGLPWELIPTPEDASPREVQENIMNLTGGAHLLVEGGRVTWEFFEALTTELLIASVPPPRDSHQGIPPWWPGASDALELQSLFTDDAHMLYYRYVLPSAARPRD